jgi:CRP-like cAMP-binding protein
MGVRTELELLRQIPLFAGAEDTHLQILSFSSRAVRFGRGETIFRRGSLGHSAFLITDGRAEVHSGGGSGPDKIGYAETGTLVGELAMIAGVSYPVTVIAASELTAKEINHDLFRRVAEEFPEFGLLVAEALSQKLQASIDDFASLQQVLD